MSFFETTKIKDADGNLVSPAEEGSLTLLRRIFQLLKPLGIITGNGSNRLSVDINNISGGTLGTISTVTAVTTVTTVNTVANQQNMGSVTAFDLMKSMSRTGYNSGVRANLTVT